MRAVRRASVVDWRERNRADNSSSCDKRTDTFDTIRFCSAFGGSGMTSERIFPTLKL